MSDNPPSELPDIVSSEAGEVSPEAASEPVSGPKGGPGGSPGDSPDSAFPAQGSAEEASPAETGAPDEAALDSDIVSAWPSVALAEDSFPDETGPPGEAAPLDSGLEAPSPVLSQGAEAPAASDSSDPEEDEEEDATSKPGGMSLLAHLAELRRRIIYSLVCVFVLACAAWNFAGPILDLIMRPVLSLLPSEAGLYYTGLPDAFSINFKVSLWAGAVGGAPFCLYQLWAFVAPGLLAEERAKVMPLTLMATVLFLAGTAFAYLVAFPMTFKFFLAFSSEAMRPLLTIDRYMSLVMSMVLAFALSFQLPLVLMFLSRLGIISSEFLRSKRGYAIVLIFILAAVLTPPDVISQIILAGTLIVLYEFSLFLVRGQERARLAARAGAEDGAGG